MPLDKTKLNKEIKTLLDQEFDKYKNSDGETPTSTKPIADAVVTHVHEEIEDKLERIIKLNLDLIKAIQTSLPAISPPGFGGTGLAKFSPEAGKIQLELTKILTDLKRSKT